MSGKQYTDFLQHVRRTYTGKEDARSYHVQRTVGALKGLIYNHSAQGHQDVLGEAKRAAQVRQRWRLVALCPDWIDVD
jgi:hypothetical protein